MMLTLLFLSFVASALAGSECPPRENIYPCSCLAVPQGKRLYFTSVTCHRLPDTDALNSIVPSLRTMTIEHFYLYDSFWEASQLGAGAEGKQVLPEDWLTSLKIKEIQIVDTPLSPKFACNFRSNCRNDITTRFTAINSSSHEKIVNQCSPKNGGKIISWTSCMNRLKEFHFRGGRLTEINADLFPLKMAQLIEVDLSFNRIMKVDKKAFDNLPKLRVLKLSHNALETLFGIASARLPELQELDVSWNMLKVMSSSFFSAFPKMKTLIANNNYLATLDETEWKEPPNTLRTIDIRENPMHCGCDLKFVNTTFHVNTVIQGHCISPEQFENSQIRRASKLLNERCTDDGQIGTRMRSTTKAM